MDILKHILEFKRKIVASGNDRATADTYGNSMTLLMVHYKGKYDTPLHITFRDMEDYIIHLVDEKYSPSYINSFIASAKRFYPLNNQPQKCDKLNYRDNPIQSPNVLTYDECMKMCNAPIYLKHKMIINLLYYGAFRRSELINLKIENISKDGRITILNSKFGESRTIPVPKHVVEMIVEYCNQFNPNVYLFNGEKGRLKYSAKSIENIIKNTAVLCGIHKRTYPHLMRSSRATILLDNGASMGYVSWFLGHKKIETTHAYYHKLTIKSMQEQFNNIDEKLLNKMNEQNQISEPIFETKILSTSDYSVIPITNIKTNESKRPNKIYEILFNGKIYLLKEKDNKIFDAPEGAKWSIGVPSEKALGWFQKKGATITETSHHIS